MRITKLKTCNKQTYTQFASLMQQLSNKPAPTQQQVNRLLKTPTVSLFGLFDKNQLIGIATLIKVTSLTGVCGHIEDVVVDESYRGQGLGKRLTNHLITTAKRHKFDRLELTSRPERVAANGLYQSLGFEKRETNVYRLKLK